LNSVNVSCGDNVNATATVSLTSPNGDQIVDAAIGTGPVDAVYKAINRIVQVPNILTEFVVQAVTEGH
jgi:2-isopropylmalate synthase